MKIQELCREQGSLRQGTLQGGTICREQHKAHGGGGLPKARDRETDEAIRGEGPIRKGHGSGHRSDEPKVNKLVTSARDLRLLL